MEIIKNFGFDPILLGAQIVNFLIIFYILKKFLHKPILEILKKRENMIKEGLEKAEESQRLLEKAAEKEKTVLKQAQIDSARLISEARDQALAVIKDAEENAKLQADRIIKEAREQIDQEVKQAEEKLSSDISRIAIDYLQKSVSELFKKDEQEEIVKRAAKQLKIKPN
ncbi:MAG: F0F1 ATP synthase subunit B [Patescibacteria group bacterium]|nr:F0F1 ATP synthase subunit B [Patescibacteria group bacterium]